MDRAIEAILLLRDHRDGEDQATRARNEAIREALSAGWTATDLADELQRRLVAEGVPEDDLRGLGASLPTVRAVWSKR